MGDLYGDRLVELALYGPQARGDTHAESDVDVLVMLDGEVQPGWEIRRMGDVRTRLGLQYGEALSPLPASSDAYEQKSSRWVANARRERRSV